MANPVGDLLFVIVDAGPEAWDGLDAVTDKFSIRAFANSLALFIKSHLMLHWTNKAVILAHNRQESGYVYPRTGEGDPEFDADRLVDTLCRLRDGDITGIGSGRGENSLPACLSMAVAYLCKRRKSDPLLSGRVLAFQACADQPAGYIPLMNCAFLCKKLRVPVDICVVNPRISLPNLSFAQQLADLSVGSFVLLSQSQLATLLPVLVALFLPGLDTRDTLVRPASASVEVRAACFCHRKPVDVAFVCSVCLSVFCERKPMCPTCKARIRSVLPSRGRGGRGGARAPAAPH